jgi:nucleoid-associated protein YgaU
MPNDAKLAMVLGVGIVVAVAIVFFHKDIVNAYGSGDRSPANGVNSPGADPATPAAAPRRYISGRPMSRVKATGSRRHTVAADDTLYGLAEKYYGDGDRFIDIYDANRDVLKRPDRLEVGTVLVIPDLPSAP